MADALDIEKIPDFMQDMEIDVEETVYINGIPEKEYYSMTVDVSDDAGKNDQEEEEEAFEFLSEKEAGQFVKVGAGLVPADQKENKEEKKKEEKKPKAKQDLVDQALVIKLDGGERDQYETFGWLGRLKSSFVSKGAKVDVKERDLGKDNEKAALDKANEEQPKVNEEQLKINEEQPKVNEEQKINEEQPKANEEQKPEEKKEEAPAMLLDHAPEDEHIAEELLEFVRKKDRQPFTFAVLDGPDRKAAGKDEPQFPKDVERPVIELHTSISNTQLNDFVSMYEAKQSEMISNRKVTKYVPVFGYSYVVFRYSCYDAAEKKYMRYHLPLGFAMKDSIAQIVEKGLKPKEDYQGFLQSAEGLPSDMSKAYRTSYSNLDDVLTIVLGYEGTKYRLLDRNANTFVKNIVEEAGLSEQDVLPAENGAKAFDTSSLIFENLGTVVGQQFKEGEKPEKKGEKGKNKGRQNLQNEELQHEGEQANEPQQAGIAGLSSKMMKGFGKVTRRHELPIDMLRRIAGVGRLNEVEPEEEFILEGLPDVGADNGGPIEEEPKRGNVNIELIELEDEGQKNEEKQDELEVNVLNLDEIAILPENNENEKEEDQKDEDQKNEDQKDEIQDEEDEDEEELPKARNPKVLAIMKEIDNLDKDIIGTAKKKKGKA